MTPFECYCEYIAIKLTLTSRSYEYWNKKKISESSFEKRNDKLFFYRLSKFSNIREMLIANFTYHLTDRWIGDILDTQLESIYLRWLARITALEYHFKSDLSKVTSDDLMPLKGNIPGVIKLLYQKKISFETLYIITQCNDLLDGWTEKIIDPLFPNLEIRLRKYDRFFSFDKVKYKQIIDNYFYKYNIEARGTDQVAENHITEKENITR